jgi:hypothetical protein
VNRIGWVVSAIAAAAAAQGVAHHPTPVDAALPLLAVVITLLAAVSCSPVMIGVPLLLAAEIAVADETTRLLSFGLILGAAFFAAMSVERRREEGVPAHESRAGVVVALAAIVVLRWIPFERVDASREITLLLLCAAIVLALRATPLAVALAVSVALFTPLDRGTSLWFPIGVLLVALVLRVVGLARIRLVVPSATLVGGLMLFFAWSGVLARGWPWLLTRAEARTRVEIGRSLAAAERAVLEVPEGAESLILSGAHVATFPEGRAIGRLDPGARALAIGDLSDWGYMRRAYFSDAANPLPASPAGTVHGHGYEAWIDGAGRVPLPKGARSIVVTADPRLPKPAVLQIEAFELGRR